MDVMDMPSAGGSGDVWVGDPATPEGDFEQVDGLTEPVAEERQAESDGTVDELEKPAQESTNNPMFEAVQSSGMSKSLTAVIVVGGVLVIVAIVGAVLATS
jgi:hypothetical protein